MGTYTFAILEVSKETYEEISSKLKTTGYEHAFHQLAEGEVIDMHGVAIRAEGGPALPKDDVLYERKEPKEFTRTEFFKHLEEFGNYILGNVRLNDIGGKLSEGRAQKWFHTERISSGFPPYEENKLDHGAYGWSRSVQDPVDKGTPIFIDGGFDPNSYEERIRRSSTGKKTPLKKAKRKK
jgi:hypothetical protein